MKHRSLTDRQQKILNGRHGKANSIKGNINPLKNLPKHALKEEILSRNIKKNFTTKKELAHLLRNELQGCSRVPVLLKNDPLHGLGNLQLSKYEIASLEPMHDIGGHIHNIFDELSYHLNSNDIETFKEVLETTLKQKQIQRNIDRRKSLLLITAHLDGKINNKVVRLLKTLVEIQRILYLRENERTPQEILRLHNSCFQHFVLLKEVIGYEPKKITKEKLYGKYLHNLLVHAPIQYRLINGRSINCEGEERFFNLIKQITGSTSSMKPGHVIGNCIIRLQVEARSKEKYEYSIQSNEIDKEIAQLHQIIEKTQYNSLFTYEFILNNQPDWQSHLERISDFLKVGEGMWWQKTEFGIEFYDKSSSDNFPTEPQISHFRSSNIKQIEQSLQAHWNQLEDHSVVIPIHEIKIQSEDGNSIYKRRTKFLEPFVSSENVPLINETLPCCEEENLPLSINDEEDSNGENILEIEEVSDSLDVQKMKETEDQLIYAKISVNSENFKEICKETGTPVLKLKTNYHEKSKQQKEKLRTYEGRSMAIVLAEVTISLRRYDSMKHAIKHKKSKVNREAVLDLLVPLQTAVLRTITKLETEVGDWERCKMANDNFCAPTHLDREQDPKIKDCIQRIDLGKTLIRSWRIFQN